MVKVLLVIEDYSEVTFLQTLLMKIGFSVDSVNKQNRVGNSLMTFQPQIVISTAKGKVINGLKLVLDHRKKYPNVKYIFVKHKGQDFVDKLVMDALISGSLETPINAHDLIVMLCELSMLNSEEILEKYRKLTKKSEFDKVVVSEGPLSSEERDESIYVTSDKSSVSEDERIWGKSTSKNKAFEEKDSSDIGGTEAHKKHAFIKNSSDEDDKENFTSYDKTSKNRSETKNETQSTNDKKHKVEGMPHLELSVGYEITDEERKLKYDNYLKNVTLKDPRFIEKTSIRKSIEEAKKAKDVDVDHLENKRKFVEALFKK